jgi:hypothetical protein
VRALAPKDEKSGRRRLAMSLDRRRLHANGNICSCEEGEIAFENVSKTKGRMTFSVRVRVAWVDRLRRDLSAAARDPGTRGSIFPRTDRAHERRA